MTKLAENLRGEDGNDKVLKLLDLVIIISSENVAQGAALVVGFKLHKGSYVVLLQAPPLDKEPFFLNREDIEWHTPGEWHHHVSEEDDEDMIEIFALDDFDMDGYGRLWIF